MSSSNSVLSVSQLTGLMKQELEGSFSKVWVCGEVSGVSRPQSGHVYFTLKDEKAQLRAVMWRSTVERLRFELREGIEAVCAGGIDLYPPRGSYQLVVRQMEPLGEGALQLAFRQLHQRLAAEGLFDAELKKPLPQFPRRIAVVTSPTGAAIRDFLEVLRRRWRGVDVLIIPARVQGEGSAREIAAGIRYANQLGDAVDVLVVTRGGGSLEDLWSFNEEEVVRAVHASALPVVSAVGHEVDITLCDLAADVRALTPSEAAERIAPAQADVEATLLSHQRRMQGRMRQRMAELRRRLDGLSQRSVLRRPLEPVRLRERACDELQQRAARAIQRQLQSARRRTDALASRLEALSPLGVLSRGYSLTRQADDGAVIQSSEQLQPGDVIHTTFRQGAVVSRVESIEPAE
ncbi:exodeoxyribonuclease VII large subunit [Lignipirellula cremea]|uniref:Exodeoxyribonuclease 7 large subunit n=1 Tax=Lignipirellula cremea TaxID=2528010 RepID=A0A518DLW0_9BACT|nr:exodeoxyribonuclease VII large subunit [Lignipirellula cremea]QDU92830.1 Exodeoxyribonuclease 7 large subunit [Lignipirellula cremea]